MQPDRRARLDLVDALRALALFGILQINIQSFAWGAGDPLGFFARPPTAADTVAYLLAGTFVQTKFISLFAFLFGFGLAMQFRSLQRAEWHAGLTGAEAVRAARSVYRRRLWFLLGLGVAHGVLLYYGDILTTYAIVGFIVVLYAGTRPARLARATRNWWIGFAVVTTVLLGGGMLALSVFPPENDPTAIGPELLAARDTYLNAGYLGQLAQRAQDYIGVQVGALMLGLPMVVALFLLGALAARLGWLRHPERFPRAWRAARWIGAAGLAAGFIGAWLNYNNMLRTPGAANLLAYLFIVASGVAFMLYVSLIVRWRHAQPMAALITWLAPAGRMPLTNYLSQSVLMGVLLSGWGFGLGDRFGHAGLALLALTIVFVQVIASRWWMATFKVGPAEAVWRRVTYGGEQDFRA